MAKGQTRALFLLIEIFGAALGNEGLGGHVAGMRSELDVERASRSGRRRRAEGAASYAKRVPERLGESQVAYRREFPE